MRTILFGLLTLSLGCGGSSATSSGATTLSGAYSLSAVDRSPAASPCYTSTVPDPNLVPPDYNVVYLVRATLTFDATGNASLNSVYETRHHSDAVLVGTSTGTQGVTYVRAGANLTISTNGTPGNGAVLPGDAALWTKQPWCIGLTDQTTTQRFDFAR